MVYVYSSKTRVSCKNGWLRFSMHWIIAVLVQKKIEFDLLRLIAGITCEKKNIGDCFGICEFSPSHTFNVTVMSKGAL